MCAAKEECLAASAAEQLKQLLTEHTAEERQLSLIGPADAAIAKVNDIYKKVLYLKAPHYETLVHLKDVSEQFLQDNGALKDVTVQFDFNPVNGF